MCAHVSLPLPLSNGAWSPDSLDRCPGGELHWYLEAGLFDDTLPEIFTPIDSLQDCRPVSPVNRFNHDAEVTLDWSSCLDLNHPRDLASPPSSVLSVKRNNAAWSTASSIPLQNTFQHHLYDYTLATVDPAVIVLAPKCPNETLLPPSPAKSDTKRVAHQELLDNSNDMGLFDIPSADLCFSTNSNNENIVEDTITEDNTINFLQSEVHDHEYTYQKLTKALAFCTSSHISQPVYEQPLLLVSSSQSPLPLPLSLPSSIQQSSTILNNEVESEVYPYPIQELDMDTSDDLSDISDSATLPDYLGANFYSDDEVNSNQNFYYSTKVRRGTDTDGDGNDDEEDEDYQDSDTESSLHSSRKISKSNGQRNGQRSSRAKPMRRKQKVYAPCLASAFDFAKCASVVDKTVATAELPARVCLNCHTFNTSSWRRSRLHLSQFVCNPCGLYEKLHCKDRPVCVKDDGFVYMVREPKIAHKTDNICSNCATTASPVWRRSYRHEILCNACGLYEKANNCKRPPLRHSFAHRGVKSPREDTQDSFPLSDLETEVKQSSKDPPKKRKRLVRSPIPSCHSSPTLLSNVFDETEYDTTTAMTVDTTLD